MGVNMIVKGIGMIGNVRLILLIVLFGALSLNTSAVAQRSRKVEKSRAQEPGDTIRINSSLVEVPISVTDAAGRPVRNLTAEDFQLEEEGKAQQVITLGAPGKSPVEIALLFDISASIFDLFPFQRRAASRFLGEVLRPNDAVSI